MVVTNLLVTVLYAVNKENIMNLMQESNKIQAYTEVLDVVEKYPDEFKDDYEIQKIKGTLTLLKMQDRSRTP